MDSFVRAPCRFSEIYDCMAQRLGVEFVRRADASGGDHGPPFTPIPAMFAALPLTQREGLRMALESLDMDRSQTVLAEISVTAPDMYPHAMRENFR